MNREEPRTIRVLLADDEPLVRSGFAMLLDAEPDLEIVGEVGDGTQAVTQAKILRPHVVIMDIRMPELNGVEATAAIVDANPAVSVLVLTTFDDDDAVHGALQAGASGFLLKNSAPHALVDAIRALAAGDAYLHPAVTRRLIAGFATRPAPTQPRPETLHLLTNREIEVLTLIAHGLSNSEIASHLTLSEATVKTHVGRILMKLGLHDRANAVVIAYQSGLVRVSDPASGDHTDPGRRGNS